MLMEAVWDVFFTIHSAFCEHKKKYAAVPVKTIILWYLNVLCRLSWHCDLQCEMILLYVLKNNSLEF